MILLLPFFISCDDGDIIVTTLDFDDSGLELCGDDEVKVLYQINNDGIFETISLRTTNNTLSDLENVLSTDEMPVITFTLDQNNKIVYRTFDAAVPADYFCNAIPPSSPNVLEELESVGGVVTITTVIDMNMEDHDGDGIPSVMEGIDIEQDTDNDGIPDYLDIDDDGDNVKTSTETQNSGGDPTDTGYPDTDGDGTPDYLDVDDDGDGVDTKWEVTEESQDPTNQANVNEAGLARYLNPLVSERFDGELIFVIENKISRRYISSVVIRNLQLQDRRGNSEEISFESYRLGSFTSSSVEVILGPEAQEPEPEE
jgi:hypothetical protein